MTDWQSTEPHAPGFPEILLFGQCRLNMFSMICWVVLLTAAQAWAQPVSTPAHSTHEEERQFFPGVVVEKVSKYTNAEAAGLKEGDILLSWSRAQSRSEIHTPFDLFLISDEQLPRGGGFDQGIERSTKTHLGYAR
jgi:hypothetical protein